MMTEIPNKQDPNKEQIHQFIIIPIVEGTEKKNNIVPNAEHAMKKKKQK